MPKYNKLVRDLIPARMDSKGIKYTVRKAQPGEYEDKLREKLSEEVQEYLTDRTPGELADILEVVYALGKIHDVDPSALEEIRLKKLSERGGFNDHIILEETND